MTDMRATVRIVANVARFLASGRSVRRQLILLNRTLRYYAGKGGKPNG